jgi:hypothetical protein
MTTKKRITKDQIEAWQGSDNLSPDALLDLLEELINGKYTVSQFREDVLDYAEELDHA